MLKSKSMHCRLSETIPFCYPVYSICKRAWHENLLCRLSHRFCMVLVNLTLSHHVTAQGSQLPSHSSTWTQCGTRELWLPMNYNGPNFCSLFVCSLLSTWRHHTIESIYHSIHGQSCWRGGKDDGQPYWREGGKTEGRQCYGACIWRHMRYQQKDGWDWSLHVKEGRCACSVSLDCTLSSSTPCMHR